MSRVLKSLSSFGSLLIVAPVFVGAVALADDKSCEKLMRNNLEQDLSVVAPEVDKLTLCSTSSSASESLSGIKGLSSAEHKASKELLCGRSKPSKSIKAKQRVLKNLVGIKLLREHEQCLQLSKNGADVIFNTPTKDGRIVNLAVEISKPGIELREVSAQPEGSMNCSGFSSLGAIDDSSVWGVCERNPQVPGPVSIIRVRLNRGLLNIRVANPELAPNQDALDGVRFQHQALPNIADCRVTSAVDRILSCSTPLGQNLCLRELRAGNVLDCRSEIATHLYVERPERIIRYERGEFEYAPRGAMAARVYRGHPQDGRLSGSVSYQVNFETPVLRPTSERVCDRSCPLFAGVEPCNRDCVFAEHVLETENAFGMLEMTRENGDSCSVPLTGSVELSETDKYRAYNLCEARNAWGGITTGIMYAQVSKFYYFNNFSTNHVESRVVRNGRRYSYDRWSVENIGERVRSVGAIEVPFMIYCDE